jgi:hypothetical protein
MWLTTDSATPGQRWVEVAVRDYSDATGFQVEAGQTFYWARNAKESDGVVRYKDWYLWEVPLPASGTPMRFQIVWNVAEDGYRVSVQIGRGGAVHLLGTAYYNALTPTYLTLGGEANHCDGNDGDASYNWWDPHYTNDWGWYDNEGDLRAITMPDSASSDLPAHMSIYVPGRASACFHMNMTDWC